MMELPVEAIRSATGLEPLRWSPVGGGYTRAGRWRVEFPDGSTAFVKAAEGDVSNSIRREIAVLASLDGSFHPRMLGSYDSGDLAAEVLEDLSEAWWPPPYPVDVGVAFAALEAMAHHAVPAAVPRLAAPASRSWSRIATAPQQFLALDVCGSSWFDLAVEHLAATEVAFDPTGDDLVHNDIWSGNMAFTEDRCVLVDWAEAHRGSRWLDVGFLTLSLRSEGGPVPTGRFPGDDAFVAWWSGDLAIRLTSEPENHLDPSIMIGLRQDLRAALAWASELFDLPPLRHEERSPA